ncbi:DUF1795 domain-containing protein [Pseudoduganella chitinolytica]|uniref:DUF1795 domain-containing protein n=1 Tax=Pseudoduganella chitinolytica TaxID=34070 RepID=A0ABY8B9E5_9BURK|nr:DUF1795 domain-containing protein [Pseudoduganella chitinolytica]WEF32425.1 DUF1795 domain-containing protein [Pseudoduganella chitinolytica]
MNDQSTTPILPNRIGLHEGSVLLPAGFADRTTNMFVPAQPQSQPNLSIARDWFAAGESLELYVDRQLGILKTRMPGHRLLAREPEKLGPAEARLAGERIDAQYKTGATIVRQRQGAFEIAPGRVLVFTAATPRAFDAQFEALWREWLDSFMPAPNGPAGTV